MDSELTLNRSLFIQSHRQPITNFYQFQKELGKGAYGVVYRAKFKSKQNCWRAVKKINRKSIKNPTQFVNQVEILKALDHPNIIKIYETYEDEASVFLVTDLCQGGQLFDRLDSYGNFSEEDARNIFIQIAQAVNYCHVQKIAHRDLKPQNFIFVDSKNLNMKLIDFGLSFIFKNNMAQQLQQLKQTKLVGTSYYIAPEIIEGYYDQRCDIWSMGVILYILVSAAPPFDGKDDREILQTVRKKKYSLEIPEMEKISDNCKDLIKKMLTDPDKRITLEEIFNHPWMVEQQSKSQLKLNFQKMLQFTKFSKLKKLAVTFIASQLSDQQIKELGQLFKQIDLNHDGFLTVEEIKFTLQNQKQNTNLLELNKLLDYVDTDKNGKINYTQFVASCLENSLIYKEENLKMVFKLLDKDGNGALSASQLKQFVKSGSLNESISTKIIQQIIKTCDKNGDGMIDYKQFTSNIAPE